MINSKIPITGSHLGTGFGHLHGLFTENLTRLSSLRSGIGGFFDNRASRTAGRPYRQVAAAFEAVAVSARLRVPQ